MVKYMHYLCVAGMSALIQAAVYVPKVKEKKPLSDATMAVKDLLGEIGFIFGIGMMLIGVYKYTEHRRNPMAHPMGQVISMVVCGAALIGLYYIPMGSVAMPK